MAEFKQLLRRIKFEKVSGKLLTRVVVITAIVFSMATLLTLRWIHEDLLAETDALRDKAAALEQENALLEDKIDNLTNIEGVEQVAQDELGLVYPDTVIFGSDAE